MGHESAIVIVDDSIGMWPKHYNNLLVVERYHYFRQSCRAYNVGAYEAVVHKNNGRDAEDDEWQLKATADMLGDLHEAYFRELDKCENNVHTGSASKSAKLEDCTDIRLIMRQRRSNVLHGMSVMLMYSSFDDEIEIANDLSGPSEVERMTLLQRQRKETILKHPLCDLIRNLGGSYGAASVKSIQRELCNHKADNFDCKSLPQSKPSIVIVMLPQGNSTEGRFSNQCIRLRGTKSAQDDFTPDTGKAIMSIDRDQLNDMMPRSIITTATKAGIPIVRSQWLHRCFYSLSREETLDYLCEFIDSDAII